MSDDLISRQEVLNKLNELDQQELYLPCHFKEFILDKLPSVQSKAGHWRDTITAGINETVCSVCLYSGFHHFNYCPYCGAKMEGKRNETKRP